MTREEQDFIIETLESMVGWAEYTPEYFKTKHRLDDDLIAVEKCVSILREIRTCENCKYLIGEGKQSSCTFNYLPKNLYEFEFSCNKWEGKKC